jgi:hypothetical protein
VIKIAEEEFGLPIRKKVWHQAILRMELQQFSGGFLLGSYIIFKV